jgi:hypothetical protein
MTTWTTATIASSTITRNYPVGLTVPVEVEYEYFPAVSGGGESDDDAEHVEIEKVWLWARMGINLAPMEEYEFIDLTQHVYLPDIQDTILTKIRKEQKGI